MNDRPKRGWPLVLGRCQAEWPLKLALLVGLNFWVYAPYLYLQKHHLFPAISMPRSFFDRLIPFSDTAAWLYLSIYLLMPIGPFLMTRREQLLRYAAGIMLIGVAADVVFLFWPTFCPRADHASPGIAYTALIQIDNEYHAFPSLHAAFAVYSAACGGVALSELNISRHGRAALWLWTLLILYATLATRQHVLADIIAGSLLGAVIYIGIFKKWIFISKPSPSLQPVAGKLTNPHTNNL